MLSPGEQIDERQADDDERQDRTECREAWRAGAFAAERNGKEQADQEIGAEHKDLQGHEEGFGTAEGEGYELAGLAVAEKLAAELKLPLPDAPWHGHRDRLAEIAAALAILAGSCGKLARDVTLLMQTDVAEAFEPAAPGRGGSSTMPQKRNPVAAPIALAAAAMAPNLAATILATQVGEHERSAGAWHAEWPTFPALLLVVSGAVRAVAEIGDGLVVDATRMRANLEATGGQIMAEAVMFALGGKLGRLEAHHVVEEACRDLIQQFFQRRRKPSSIAPVGR